MSFLPPQPLTTAATARAPAGRERVGVLLLNLGTPDGTDYCAVRRYLKEFLSDPRVIEVPPILWQPILQMVILSFRPFKSGANYKRIWNMERNESPLRTYTRAQAEKLREALPADGPIVVDWAMRYGTPSIDQGVKALVAQGCQRILALPLYPQYSATTTATANDMVFRSLIRMRHQPAVRTAPAFPDHPAYIDALAATVRRDLGGLDWQPQMLLTSFHGLPQRYAKAGDPYPQDCYRTRDALAQALGLTAETLPLTFQSRFGREPWLQPYTDGFVRDLPGKGIKRLAVISPGFLADCIETLDELGHELREEFMEAGGEQFHLIPCLNDQPEAIAMLETLVKEELAGWI